MEDPLEHIIVISIICLILIYLSYYNGLATCYINSGASAATVSVPVAPPSAKAPFTLNSKKTRFLC